MSDGTGPGAEGRTDLRSSRRLVVSTPTEEQAAANRGRRPHVPVEQPSLVDRVFSRGLLSAALTVLVLLVAIGIFLLWQSRHAFAQEGLSFFTRSEFNIFSNPLKWAF